MSRVVIEAGRVERQYRRDLWRFRELLLLLAWRDVSVRYSQTVVGVAWAVTRPLATMAVMAIVFGTIAKLPSGGVPYPLPPFETDRDPHPANAHGHAKSGQPSATSPDAPLLSGTYGISVWLGDGTGAVHEHLPDVVRFDLVAAEGLSSRYSTRVIGPVRVSARWSVASDDPDENGPAPASAERGCACSE